MQIEVTPDITSISKYLLSIYGHRAAMLSSTP